MEIQREYKFDAEEATCNMCGQVEGTKLGCRNCEKHMDPEFKKRLEAEADALARKLKKKRR